jgi:hypothetical protein
VNYLVTYVEYYMVSAEDSEEALKIGRSGGSFLDREIYVDNWDVERKRA